MFVGRGKAATLELRDPSVEERHLSLRVLDDRLQLDPLGGTSSVRVNDVACIAPLMLSAGDEIALGDSTLTVLALRVERELTTRMADEDELYARLTEEVRRSRGQRGFGLTLVSTAGLNVAARTALMRRVTNAVERLGTLASWGELAADLLVGLFPEANTETLGATFGFIQEVAGPRAKTSFATFPADGDSADALMETVLCRLLGLPARSNEVVVADASMVRLSHVAAALAASGGAVAVCGAPGSGRTTLAEAMFRARGQVPVAVQAKDGSWFERHLARLPQALLVTDAEQAPSEVLHALIEAKEKRRLVVAVSQARLERFQNRLEIPELATREADLTELAELFLKQARTALGRPKLSLSEEARRALKAYHWPGQVRELRWVILRAARAAMRDEVGHDALPSRLLDKATFGTLRGTLKQTEREILLGALGRTRWNVTAAAARLGIPRRTVVYRMAKLGLRRPTR
jgi:hypothetical protein